MLILGIIVLVIGACVAALVHRTIGLLIAAVGAILVIWALLIMADNNTAHAAMQLARSSWSRTT